MTRWHLHVDAEAASRVDVEKWNAWRGGAWDGSQSEPADWGPNEDWSDWNLT